jgi:hypothetical protein
MAAFLDAVLLDPQPPWIKAVGLATGICAQANEAVASPESNRKVEGDHAFDQPTRSDEQQPASAR